MGASIGKNYLFFTWEVFNNIQIPNTCIEYFISNEIILDNFLDLHHCIERVEVQFL